MIITQSNSRHFFEAIFSKARIGIGHSFLTHYLGESRPRNIEVVPCPIENGIRIQYKNHQEQSCCLDIDLSPWAIWNWEKYYKISDPYDHHYLMHYYPENRFGMVHAQFNWQAKDAFPGGLLEVDALQLSDFLNEMKPFLDEERFEEEIREYIENVHAYAASLSKPLGQDWTTDPIAFERICDTFFPGRAEFYFRHEDEFAEYYSGLKGFAIDGKDYYPWFSLTFPVFWPVAFSETDLYDEVSAIEIVFRLNQDTQSISVYLYQNTFPTKIEEWTPWEYESRILSFARSTLYDFHGDYTMLEVDPPYTDRPFAKLTKDIPLIGKNGKPIEFSHFEKLVFMMIIQIQRAFSAR